MCKNCGCGADDPVQLLLKVEAPSGDQEMKTLLTKLLGAPGVLQVQEENAGQVLVDFNPQQNTRPNLEQVVVEAGFSLLGAEERQREHKHGVIPFIRRVLGRG